MVGIYDLVIVGGGPAGLTSGLYASRGGLKALLLERMGTGGQAAMTHLIENYPGFPKGIGGAELADLMTEQAKKFGLELEYAEVTGIDKTVDYFLVKTAGNAAYPAKAVIIAAGARPKKLGVPGEDKLAGAGVSYCATCDGAFFKDRDVVVVGGGNTALEDALYLTRFAGRVTVVHRRDSLRAAKILQERAFQNPRIEFEWDSVVRRITGERLVEGVVLSNVKTGEEKTIPASGVFVAVGHLPNSDFVRGLAALDEGGYVLVNQRMETNCPGVFAAGDICQKGFRQVITAAADGAAAAHFAQEWLTLRQQK
ncbi:MAG: thioredoxin-disulfide reductase [Peptococcaceae bacterium]|jgi:thioredoxin reductase (NADPH)|nr:thioredoxin-disulfide reductase [Peptococcaceae bacterium]MDH7524576.1 thioredoxin-disulfide reductase [Peptococcaceae bacterium]